MAERSPVLVELNDIKPFISNGLHSLLSNVDHFLDIEYAASCIARDNCGLTLPESIDKRADWVVLPMAWIISYLELPNLKVDTDTVNTYTRNYNNAIDMISKGASSYVAPAESTSAVSLSGAGTYGRSDIWV